ncbi:hypothetical protein [Patulibacter minatonensis]|uniref:hypothetical protein n=1 Tax=Patulibacter minatonensis TaxID=298163 RepID=UPI00047DDA07|nr:hypothetical protein [Patulibacter minatonensis]
MGIGERLAAKAAAIGEQAKEVAATRAREAADAAKDAVTARTEGGLLGLLRMDDERPVTIEGVTVLLVAAVRRDESRGLSDRDVLKAAKRRYRRLGTLSLPSGPVGGILVNLYCEAATLCDVVELRGVAMSDDAVAAHLLVLWHVLPDLDVAAAAVAGDGLGVVDELRARARERVAAVELPDPMTKRAALTALWRLNGLAGDAMEAEGTGVRERLFPGRRVKAFVREAGEQLDRAA